MTTIAYKEGSQAYYSRKYPVCIVLASISAVWV